VQNQPHRAGERGMSQSSGQETRTTKRLKRTVIAEYMIAPRFILWHLGHNSGSIWNKRQLGSNGSSPCTGMALVGWIC
jgi:hypothetical protein